MTRVEARRRKQRIREIQRIFAWVVIVGFELLMAAAPTAITAAFLLPLAYKERGYYGIGGEWLMIAFIFCFTYTEIHKAICNRIFDEEE